MYKVHVYLRVRWAVMVDVMIMREAARVFGLHRAGVEFRSLAEDFDTATPTGKLQLSMVLTFSEWWRNSIRERSVAGQAKAADRGAFPRPTAQPD